MSSTHRGIRDGANDYLVIYLQDHDAAAGAGRALARRCADSNSGNQLGAYLRSTFLPELRSDHECVVALLESVGATPSRVKRIALRVGEFVGRAKPNGRVWRYSPLSRVVELESLIAGVHAKQRLWTAIEKLSEAHPSLPDVSGHKERAETQLTELQRHHVGAIEAAFNP